MQLERIEIENFRQFRNEVVEFSTDPSSNVTIIHGSNGSGKTTFLNAFTWLFYDEVDFDSRPERLASEGAMAEADIGEEVDVSVRLRFTHENALYVAQREAVYEKQTSTDFDGDLVDMELTVKLKEQGQWVERQNPSNTLDQIIPKRLSGLFFFDGEDIDELAGIDNQDRIQEAIENIMGLTILERGTKHLEAVASRFEDEVEEYASEELSELINEKRALESDIDELERKQEDTIRKKERTETEISDIEQKLNRFNESKELQNTREKVREEKGALEEAVDDINDEIRTKISTHGFVPLAMPLISETAEQLDDMREQGVIPSELNNEFIQSLLDAETCICGRPLEPGTDHYHSVESMQGDAVTDGVEQSALRIIGHLNQVSEIEDTFFDEIDDLIAERMDLHSQIESKEEWIDDISTELQELDQTTESGESISDMEATREAKEAEREKLISEIGRIEERIEQHNNELEALKDQIEEQQDEKEEALLAKRRQKAAEMVGEQLESSFAELKGKVRDWSNESIQQTFDDIASKNLTAEITDSFELKIWQTVGDDRVEVDKSTGERQIASLAFIGSLVKIARERYESDSDTEYFTGGIYPLVMDSPFGALDKSHRREVSKVIPKLANQVVVFATDSQWEGPVQEEMADVVGKQYWLDFDDGEGAGNHPQTAIRSERAAAGGD